MKEKSGFADGDDEGEEEEGDGVVVDEVVLGVEDEELVFVPEVVEEVEGVVPELEDVELFEDDPDDEEVVFVDGLSGVEVPVLLEGLPFK